MHNMWGVLYKALRFFAVLRSRIGQINNTAGAISNAFRSCAGLSSDGTAQTLALHKDIGRYLKYRQKNAA
jgi:hypothetical protein